MQIWTAFTAYFLEEKLINWPVYLFDQTKVRKIDVMRKGPGKFKSMFALLKKG